MGQRQPRGRRDLVAVWQQDRWSNGGAQGNLTGVSFDRGRSWQRPTLAPLSRCAGGNAANGGNYARASDPLVSFGGDGSAHQIALMISADQEVSAILVSSSRDGGRSWGRITTLQRDTTATLFNDKESITADPRNGRFVYALWDRLQIQDPADPASPFSGDTLFSRSTDGGRTWEQTRVILDFEDNSRMQTLGNQSATQRQGGVIDPRDGQPIRTGDLLPEAAADPRRRSDTIHIAWQDIRFTLAAPLP